MPKISTSIASRVKLHFKQFFDVISMKFRRLHMIFLTTADHNELIYYNVLLY